MNSSVELELQKALADRGFAVVEQVLASPIIASLIEAIAVAQKSTFAKRRSDSPYAVRNVLKVIPAIQALASEPPITWLVCSILGANAHPVKALLFDKTVEANWKVAWHQDLMYCGKGEKAGRGFHCLV